MRDGLQNLKRAFIPYVTLNRLGERGNTPCLIAILYFGKRKRFLGRRRLESPSLLCFMNQLRGERRLKGNRKKQQQQIGQTK